LPTIEPLRDVDVNWVQGFPESEWAERLTPLAQELTEEFFPGCVMGGTGLFVLAPGQMHPAHVDIQPPEWVTRVHVPLVTNQHCTATMWDGFHEMSVGKAYSFNTRISHAVSNAGDARRIHLVFDIKRAL